MNIKNKKNKISLINSVKYIMLFVAAITLGLFFCKNNALAGGGLGGLLPGDPVSTTLYNATGLSNLFCTFSPIENAVYKAVGINYCGKGGGGSSSNTNGGGAGSGGAGSGSGSGGSSCNCDPSENASHCSGATYTNGCGKTCNGSRGPDCSGSGSYCSKNANNQPITYSSPNGCGSCNGSKAAIHVPVCLYSDAESCNQSNCNKEITTKKAYCVGISNTMDSHGNKCGPLQLSNYSGCNGSCENQMTTCPPCSWKEIAP